MGLVHAATITPTKAEMIGPWASTQAWGPAAETPIEMLGAFRIDDPEGQVGIEIHLVRADGTLMQVPLTYRDAPLDGAEDALLGTMEHSALGTRWVYDGLRDPRLVMMYAAVALTGQGEALAMVELNGRWNAVPTGVRIHGGGWTAGRVPVDGLVLERDDASGARFRGDRFDLVVLRRPQEGARPPIGLTATWPGQPTAVILAEVVDHQR